VEDLEPVAGELEERHLDEVLWRHPAGFEVLLAPGSPAAGEQMVAAYRAALPVAAGARGAVVGHVRRAPGSAGVPSAVLPLTERIVLVLAQDVLSFRGARRAVEALDAAGLASRVGIVVNRARRAEITPKDAERAFGRLLAVVPVDRKVGHVQDRG